MLLTCALTASAQKVYQVNRLVDSVLAVRYYRSNIDTAYVERPQTKWTLKGRINVTGAGIAAEGLDNGTPFKTELDANRKTTLSIGVSYLGLGVNLSINPAKMLGEYHDYEIGFRSYGKRLGYELTYQDASNFQGWSEWNGDKQRVTTTEDMFRLQTVNANGYFVFNHRRFSYPAAFAHSYIQRRSAGSALLAISGQWQRGKVKGEEQGPDNERETMNFKMLNVGLGAGYGYNYVPGHNWLLHISALPTLIVYSHTSITMNDQRIPLHYQFPEVIITGRAAIVKQIGSNMFAGFSSVYNFSKIGTENDLTIKNEKWLTRLYFGVRL